MHVYIPVPCIPDLALPGLALPEAFQSLDSRLESVMQLCTAKGSPEAQLVGVVTVCEELQQLLKCAFIGGLRVKYMKQLYVITLSVGFNVFHLHVSSC